MQDVRRTLIKVEDEIGNVARIEILLTGQVRLRLGETLEATLMTETLEELINQSAICEFLSNSLYTRLFEELDFIGLRGQ